MPRIRAIETPANSQLGRYAAAGAFTDCYLAELPFRVALAQFVEAFSTTRLFKAERLLLRLVARPSTDAQAALLAHGQATTFAAWSVESRTEHEVLLATGRTRSWLMVIPEPGAAGVQLLFGSAVVPKRRSAAGRGRMGLLFGSLLGFHRLYSRALLAAARARLSRHA